MACEPSEIFALASSLANSPNAGEAEMRSAISRAYYAALHSVAITFPKREGQYRKDGESSHAEIIGRSEVFAANPGQGRSDALFISKLMPRLRRTRNEADYRLDMELGRKEASETIDATRAVMERCQRVRACQQEDEKLSASK